MTKLAKLASGLGAALITALTPVHAQEVTLKPCGRC